MANHQTITCNLFTVDSCNGRFSIWKMTNNNLSMNTDSFYGIHGGVELGCGETEMTKTNFMDIHVINGFTLFVIRLNFIK